MASVSDRVPAESPERADAQVFVPDLDHPELTGQDEHHLRRVLRLRPGAALAAADGHGAWRPCRLGDDPVLVPEGDVVRVGPPAGPVTVAFALAKGEKPDWVVQKLTELGVDRIVPFVADRSVVRWDDQKAERNLGRFATIARHAAMQCRRLHLPTLGLPSEGSTVPGFDRVASLPGAHTTDVGGVAPGPDVTTVLIGPEGGWSSEEWARDLPRLTLGPHVLRAETAAVTAGALLIALRSDIVRPVVSSQVRRSPEL